jgi:hypothetical protein
MGGGHVFSTRISKAKSCGAVLATLAAVIFSLAPLVHGLVHPDHLVEAFAAAHGASPHGAPAKGKTDDGSTCPYQIFGAHAQTILGKAAALADVTWLSVAHVFASDVTPDLIVVGTYRNRGPPA